MSFKHYALGAFATSVFCLQACGGDAKADASTPDGAIMSNVQALQNNDMSAYVDSLLTAGQKTKLATEWDDKRISNPPDDFAKEQFKAKYEEFTSDSKIEKIMPFVKSQLEGMNSDLLAGLITKHGGKFVGSSTLDEQQKKDAAIFISSLSKWVKTSDACNPENVRAALKSLQSTAKELNIKTLDDLTALSFNQLVDKGDIVLAGVKKTLNVYKISLDDILNSVQIDKVEADGAITNVTVSFEIFGTKQTTTAALKQVGGKWIESTIAKKVEEAFANM